MRAAFGPHPRREIRLVDESRDCRSEGVRRRLAQQTRASDDDGFERTAVVDGNHRTTGRHRLERHDAEVLRRRRVHHHERAIEPGRLFSDRGRLDEDHLLVQLTSGRLLLESFAHLAGVGATVHPPREDQPHAGKHVGRHASARGVERVKSQRQVLARVEAAHREDHDRLVGDRRTLVALTLRTADRTRRRRDARMQHDERRRRELRKRIAKERRGEPAVDDDAIGHRQSARFPAIERTAVPLVPAFAQRLRQPHVAKMSEVEQAR